MRCVPFLALILLAAFPCHAIGTRTHAEIGLRCVKDYLLNADEMLPGLGSMLKNRVNQNILYRACEFPDWGYGGINPDAAEASHWHPFNKAWAALLEERHYSMPPDETAQKELAFFFGAVCHDIADIPWHFSHGKDKSFLQMAQEMDHASHGDTEVGVDLVKYTENPLKHIGHLSNWVPFDTLMAVMQRANLNVTPQQLQNGITRENLVMWFGPLVGEFQACQRRAALPWCMAHLEDYYYGGIQHNEAACAMWVRYWYAEVLGGHCLQQMPCYFDNTAPDSGYVPYLGVMDTTLLEELPDNNAGQEPFLQLGGPAGKRRATLLRFDLGAIAQGKPVRKAVLWLAAVDTATGTPNGKEQLSLTPVPTAWQEGAGVSDPYNGTDGRTAVSGEAKWNDFFPNASPESVRIPLPALTPNQWLSMEVTPFVQMWLKNPESNFGMLLQGLGESSAITRFYSSQAFRADASGYCGGTRIAFRPMLILLP